MWLKNIDKIAKYLPKDGLIHDIQIIGAFIYVDGDCQNPYIQGYIEDGKIIDRALTEEEVLKKYNKTLELTEEGRGVSEGAE